MTTPFICLLLVLLLAWPSKLAVMWSMSRSGEGYDNKHPRALQQNLTGWKARAMAAHYNTLEAFPAFAGGVMVAHLAGLDAHRASVLSIVVVVVRAVYPALYVANLDYLRTAVWTVGYAAILGLYILPWVLS